MAMSARALILLPLLAGLAACAMPEARLRTGLEHAGLSPRMAACMAERMVDRLSLMQLRRIGDLPRAGAADSTAEAMHRLRALGDPEILRVSGGAAAICEARRLLG
jgi:hypothetical protein